jgi:hypothetical protein
VDTNVDWELSNMAGNPIFQCGKTDEKIGEKIGED